MAALRALAGEKALTAEAKILANGALMAIDLRISPSVTERGTQTGIICGPCWERRGEGWTRDVELSMGPSDPRLRGSPGRFRRAGTGRGLVRSRYQISARHAQSVSFGFLIPHGGAADLDCMKGSTMCVLANPSPQCLCRKAHAVRIWSGGELTSSAGQGCDERRCGWGGGDAVLGLAGVQGVRQRASQPPLRFPCRPSILVGLGELHKRILLR